MSVTSVQETKSAAIRARLDHPVIDSDGHAAEFEPAMFDVLRDIGGSDVVERFKKANNFFGMPWYELSLDERRKHRVPRPHWWVHPAKNTLDRATGSLPKLMYERMDEMGLDFTMVYPSLGFGALHMPDDELRGVACRAFNTYQAEIYAPYADRMTATAIIPMHTPAEAIAELDHAVGELGMKVVMLAGYAQRPIPAAVGASTDAAKHAFWLDTFGIDSDYDYDPVWAKCIEIKVAPSFHSVGLGWGSRLSISNFMYNHIGHFAAAAEALCKSLFFGGVTRRFPELRCTFLEAGAGWACTLLNDLVGHWEKHNVIAVQDFNPASLDMDLMQDLFQRYGGPKLVEQLAHKSERSELLWGRPMDDEYLDEWGPCEISEVQDIHDLFVPNFYFGCEGDDRSAAWAFNKKSNPFGTNLKVVYGSDIGHFDLPDMRDAGAEAWELVEHGVLTEEQFQAFVFTNPVTVKTQMNPEFFKGTIVEDQVAKLLAG